MSFFSFYVENGKHVSDWNVVDNIFEFNPFVKSKLILSRSKVHDSWYYFLIIYSIQNGTNSVEGKDTKILALEGSYLNDTLFNWSHC